MVAVEGGVRHGGRPVSPDSEREEGKTRAGQTEEVRYSKDKLAPYARGYPLFNALPLHNSLPRIRFTP